MAKHWKWAGCLILVTVLCIGSFFLGRFSERIKYLEERLLEETQVTVEETQVTVEESLVNETTAPLQTQTSPEDTLQTQTSPENTLQTQISTMEEAVAYLDNRFPELWMSAHTTDGIVDYWWLDDGETITKRESNEPVGRSSIVNAVTYLLCDDMDIYTVIGYQGINGSCGPLYAINCIKTADGYQFIDPVSGMQGDAMSRYGALLPEATTATLEEYAEMVLSYPAIAETLQILCLYENGERFEFYEDNGVFELRTPAAQILYTAQAKSQFDLKNLDFGPEDIGSYQLSKYLGGVTLTVEEAYALVDAEPEEVKEKVKTAPDLLLYMLAARIGDNGGCYCNQWGSYTWHTNYTAQKVMQTKLGNCGSCANLANYLLEGDYEEIGFILHAYYPGNGGGHVYNYIKYQGAYYIVDFSWYIFSAYQLSNDFPVIKLDKLEDYGSCFQRLYGGVSLILAHESAGRHLPNVFGEQYGDDHYYVPEGAEYTVLYESGDGYLIGELPFDKKYYDWEKWE